MTKQIAYRGDVIESVHVDVCVQVHHVNRQVEYRGDVVALTEHKDTTGTGPM